ncbi:MAG TPA: phage major capsid protein [Gammaproteobacteria bacterium]|nr:phage major capsid protein [Gammaproteobacteria bacterium]
MATSPNSTYTEIVTTTLAGYSKTMADNVTNNNALLRHIDQNGNKSPATGRTIVQELEYAVNSTTKWYSGYEVLDTSTSNVFTAAEFNYKQLAGNVVISGLEQVENSGPEQIFNLLKSRIRNLEKSLKNDMATALYADGTGTDSKELGGLQLLVPGTVGNTVGGINSGTYTFWANQVYDFSTETVTPSATTIQTAMNTLWLACIRGADRPNVIVADSVYFGYYWASLQTNQRFTSDESASAGFMNLMFMDAPVYYDDQCPASKMYFLNTDYLFLRYAEGREFVPLGEKASVNQDALVMPVAWAGNMTVSNRARQGVIQA